MRLLWALGLSLFVVALGCGPKGVEARMAHGESRANKADDVLDEAELHMQNLAPKEAESSLKEARSLLTHPDVEYYPERHLLRERLERDEGLLPEVHRRRAQRDLEERVAKQTERLTQAQEPFENALSVLNEKKDLEDDDADAAEDALESLEDALKTGESIEAEDKGYAARASTARSLVMRMGEKVRLAAAIVALREGPGEKSVEGKSRGAAANAKGASADDRLDAWEDAFDAYARCEEDGKKLLVKHPALAATKVKIGTGITTGQALVTSCETQRKAFATRVSKEKARREAEAARIRAAEERAERQRRLAEERRQAAEEKTEARRRAAEEQRAGKKAAPAVKSKASSKSKTKSKR